MTAIDELFTARTELDGRRVDFILSIRSYADLAYFLAGVPKSDAQARDWLISRIFREVATIDGRQPLLEEISPLLDHPRVVGDIFAARNRMHDEARQRGMMFAQCPGCRETEADISFMYLMLRLRMSPPPLTTPDGVWLPPPRIATIDAFGRGWRRGDLPVASRIRFELPSARMGLGKRGLPGGGVLAMLDEDAVRRVSSRRKTSDDPAWWHEGSLPFVALIRLAAAVAELDSGKRATPQLLQKLPAFDLEYLELAVFAAQLTDEPREEPVVPGLVPRPRNLPVTCPRCRTVYLPLL